MSAADCGGCAGLGAHRRWCPEVVGRRASLLGTLSEEAEALADKIGPNHIAASNHCYAAAGRLLEEAREAADEYALRIRDEVET